MQHTSVWKTGPVGSVDQIRSSLLRLQSFLWQQQKRREDVSTSRFLLKLTALGTTAGDVLRFQISKQLGTIITVSTILEITTAVTGLTLDIGDATTDSTSSDTLFADQDASSTGLYLSDNIIRIPYSEFITATASATPTGLTGNLYVEYLRAGVGVVAAE